MASDHSNYDEILARKDAEIARLKARIAQHEELEAKMRAIRDGQIPEAERAAAALKEFDDAYTTLELKEQDEKEREARDGVRQAAGELKEQYGRQLRALHKLSQATEKLGDESEKGLKLLKEANNKRKGQLSPNSQSSTAVPASSVS
ncbi:MAG: hypothetical protein M1820_005509 [Bogoriella megaspora]|nr:MAG: hypothetical protein M1820_005509 [Bogoriella megaspora]